jgi:hypothetical protein
MRCQSVLLHICVLPRRLAILTLFSFVLGALMLASSLHLHRKSLETLHVSLEDDHLIRAPQHDYAKWECERRLSTPAETHFEAALRNLTDLLPDEVIVEQLLSPLDHTEGTTMLHDLAVRTRVFSTLFAAWEALHIVPMGLSGGITIRQNIVEHIRQESPKGADEAIGKYDVVRSFVNQFSRHLFPWIARHSPDHMVLHASHAIGGRGIVITVGDHQTPYVLTSVKTFRELGCDLPVEVFFLGSADLNKDSRTALAKLPGVITRDLSKMIYDDGWTLKGTIERRLPVSEYES